MQKTKDIQKSPLSMPASFTVMYRLRFSRFDLINLSFAFLLSLFICLCNMKIADKSKEALEEFNVNFERNTNETL